MTDTSFCFLKFSPLKTPDVRKAKTSDDEYATSSSVASSVTNEIITLSQSVQKKLSSDKMSASSESSPEKRSGENLFLTQRFCEPDSKKRKGGVKMEAASGKKPNITGSDSDTDESSGSDLETTGNKKLQNKQVKKKPANKEKHSKANNRSSSSSSSSSDSESDSSRSSIDNAKYQSLKERLKANSFKNDVSSSDSDSESSSGSVQGQVGEDKQVENFSQDLFSPVSVKQNRKNSSEGRVKSPMKVLEQQKSEILKAEEERHGNKGKQPYHSESELESDFDNDANEVKENESKALKTNLKTKLMESPQMLGTSPDKKKSAEAQMRERVAHDVSSSESESGESDMSSVIAKLPENSVISPQNSSSGSEQDSESDNDDAEKLENIVNTPTSHSPQKGSRQKLKPTETLKHSQRQSNITDHCSSPIDRSSKNASSVKKSQIRYEAPVGFEADDQTNRYVREKEVQGRQLWLIQTPVDFDITALDNKKVKFDGIQTVCMQDEKEKQYEIVIRPCQENQGQGYSSVVMDEEGYHKLGDSISGQIQVLDWIPGIPPVKIDIPTPQKHEVPDNLTLRYVPFGAESPKRQEETTLLHAKRTKRKHEKSHREGKKKKKKKIERKEL